MANPVPVARCGAPMLRLVMLLAWLAVPSILAAQGVERPALSQQEAQLADCVGGALAIESLWRGELHTQPGAEAEAMAAMARADTLLRLALSRYVGIGHVQPFRQRSATALAAARVRFSVIAPMVADPTYPMRDLLRRNTEDCRPFLPP